MTPATTDTPTSILITGASGAIGSALAKTYAAAGRMLILQGRSQDRLAAVAAECEQLGARVECHPIDLDDTHQREAWLKKLATVEPPDLLIVNAGVTSHNRHPEQRERREDIRSVLDVNLAVAIALTEILHPLMRRRGHGQIALISSLSAYIGLPLTPSYCASKAGLKAYGEALRGWLRPHGVRVSVVLPGFVRSAMSDRFPGDRPFMVTADRAATVIRRGLARDRARIAFPIPLSWGMWWLSVLPPDLGLWILRRLGYGGGPGT